MRGMGVGIIVTTVIFMILIFIHRNDGAQQDAAFQDTESRTVAEYENDAQKPEGTEEAASTEPLDSDTEHTEDTKPAAADTETPDTKPDDALPEPDVEPETDPAEQTEPDGAQDGQDMPQADALVQIEVSDGQFSDSVCQMLQEAGLIEDAADFNNYLVDNHYDHSIFPGTYEIPNGSTYEELAALLTRK